MKKEELNSKLDKELTPTENALINFNIYHNPDHVEYYENFHMGNYQWCYDYLISNRGLLTIEHTPDNLKVIANYSIKAAKAFYGGLN